MFEVVNIHVNRSLSVGSVHDQTKRIPKQYPSIKRHMYIGD
ncbi:hypothetical protein GGC63_006391 [Paenibacillus sp. OAS669]|nr:hypothetical protein [Paenibacillus sp. OAS669]